MRVAFYGSFMYQLAMGLRESTDHEVHLYLNDATLPHCLADEPPIADRGFAHVDRWESAMDILRPGRSRLVGALREYDVAVTTDHGPIFARAAGIPHAFIPSGSDLTQWPFPWRSRAARQRGRADILAFLIAWRLRAGIRESAIWMYPFSKFGGPLERLKCAVDANLAQPIDMDTFSPDAGQMGSEPGTGRVRVFHPSRMMFTAHPFLIESMGWKRNDLLIRGVSAAAEAGVDVELVLVSREGSHDEGKAVGLIDELGLGDRVEWLRSDHPQGFTWQEVAGLCRSADLVVDEFGGCLGLVALEGAACGRPSLNFLRADGDEMGSVVDALYPDGHCFLQASGVEEIRDVIVGLVDADRRERIGSESRKWMEGHHDRRVVGRHCTVLLQELIAAGQRTGLTRGREGERPDVGWGEGGDR